MNGLRRHMDALYAHGRADEAEFRRLTGADDAPAGMERDHVDCVWQGRTVDVKGRKACHEDDVLLIEFRTVDGRPGWVVSGAELIAFRMARGFFVVRREDLYRRAQAGVKSKVVWDSSAVDHRTVWYEMVRRRGRKDLFLYAPLGDFLVLKHVWVLPNGEVEVHDTGY